MAERPGILFYFSLLNDLEDYTTEEIGQLFLAAMKYGATGEVTEFTDRGMRSVFRNLMKYADVDQEKFNEKTLQRAYAGWKSSQIRKGVKESDLLPYDDWKVMKRATTVDDRQQPLTTVESRSSSCNEINQYPITNTQYTVSNNQHPINNGLSSIRDGGKMGVQGEGTTYRPNFVFPPRETAVLLAAPPAVRELFRDWTAAMNEGDKQRGLRNSNELFKAGYSVDVATGQLSKRTDFEGG